MNHIGVSAGFHDAALSVVDDAGNILFAGHSERYSKRKHDADICHALLEDAHNYINGNFILHYYERPLLKAARQFLAGQAVGPIRVKNILGDVYKSFNQNGNWQVGKTQTHGHHHCHAAAGFQTSPFKDATIVIIDAIGELDTITIWDARYDKDGIAKYKRLWSQSYPNSIGLMYSALTQRVGLRPLDEEYILMGMAAFGKPKYVDELQFKLLEHPTDIIFRENLHIGLPNDLLKDAKNEDIACSAQALVERLIITVLQKAAVIGKSRNLVYGGGVALNCVANRFLGKHFENVWIMPNPGDAGSSVGAAALGYGKKLNWQNAYLGYNISGAYPVSNLLVQLHTNKIVGVASGRAEFGPRALGNRSILADPRGPEIKDKVNEIKHREKFRPFAPIILEEQAATYFDMPRVWRKSPYMQSVGTCKLPTEFPAVCHVDGSCRVQTVSKDGSGIRQLLEAWYEQTGCPMLLNTSLNIRNEPMVNDISDAVRFEKLYSLKVCS